jgi:hypothetical protein
VDAGNIDRLSEPWIGLARHLADGNGVDRRDLFAKYTQGWPNTSDILRVVLQIDPLSPPPEDPPATESIGGLAVEMPPLPPAARLSDEALAKAEQVGEWLTAFTDYAAKRSPMTPKSFLEAGGLWLGAVAIARRLYCKLPHADIYPNLYIVWAASTTLFAKSTGLAIVEELARDALNHLLLPAEFTPEALLAELAGKDPPGLDDLPADVRELWQQRRNFAAQRGLLLEEFSGILASAKKDYNAGLTEHLLRLHDCGRSWSKRTQGGGLVTVKYPYISLLGATTPEALAAFLTRTAWLSGFWPRFALLSPDVERPPFKRTEKRPERPAWLVEGLSKLANHDLPVPTFPAPPVARPVTLAPDAYEAWRRYDRAMRYDLLTDELDNRLWGVYGRLPTQAVKISVILSALDWSGEVEPNVTLGHWARAQQIVEKWRASVHRLLVPAQAQEETRREERVLAAYGRAGESGVTVRDVYRTLGMERSEVERLTNNLLRDGLLEEVRGEQRTGRRTTRYRAI